MILLLVSSWKSTHQLIASWLAALGFFAVMVRLDGFGGASRGTRPMLTSNKSGSSTALWIASPMISAGVFTSGLRSGLR